MEIKDLIEKLETIKTPEIEIQSHRQKLKMAWLDSGRFRKISVMFWVKRLVPAGVALALILIIGFTIIHPKIMEARAMEIAKNDPQIQKVMEETGAVIKEVKIKEGKAYALLALPEKKIPSIFKETEERILKGIGAKTDEKKLGIGEEGVIIAPVPIQVGMITQNNEGEIEFFNGTVAEIDLKAKKVKKLEFLEKKHIPITPLTKGEKTRAIEIAKSERKIKEMILNIDEAEVIVKPMPPFKLRFDKDPDEIRAESGEDKRANVILRWDGRQDIITVNLTTGKVEGAMGFSRMKPVPETAPTLEFPKPITPKLPDTIKKGEVIEEIHTISPPRPEIWGYRLPEEKEIKFEAGNKNLEELLEDAELISEKGGIKVYRLSNGDILELKETDEMTSIRVKSKE